MADGWMRRVEVSHPTIIYLDPRGHMAEPHGVKFFIQRDGENWL